MSCAWAPQRSEEIEHWPDERLLRAVAAQDERALRTLFRRYAPRFTALARHLNMAGDLEEAVRAAFLAIVRDAARFEAGRVDARTWLVGVAHRSLTRQSVEIRG